MQRNRRFVSGVNVIFRAITAALDVNACKIAIMSNAVDISPDLGLITDYDVIQAAQTLVSTVVQDDVNDRTQWLAGPTTWVDPTRTAALWAVYDTDDQVLVAGDIGRNLPWPENNTFRLNYTDVGLLDSYQTTYKSETYSMTADLPMELWRNWS